VTSFKKSKKNYNNYKSISCGMKEYARNVRKTDKEEKKEEI